MKQLHHIFFAVFTFILAASTWAGEDALYEAEAPEDSAFIRVFNLNAGAEIKDFSIGGKTVSGIKSANASDYIFVPEGAYDVTVDGKQTKTSLKRGNFYTVVIVDGEVKVIDDEHFDNRRKSMITFYNFLSNDASLATSDGKVKIVKNVNFKDKASREINPVKVELVTMVSNKAYGPKETVNLERGRVTSLFAVGSLENPMLVKVTNKIDTSI
ncbi:hypothetical protein TDB9533_02512 [Thalassocella blandensis]|nr:hypothetical protein TDB9533_02512 [Thalassocella blandensis]